MKEKEWEAWKACIPRVSHQVMAGIIKMDIMRPLPLTGGKQNKDEDFPGGPVIKNLPACAANMNLVPDSGGSHILWGK